MNCALHCALQMSLRGVMGKIMPMFWCSAFNCQLYESPARLLNSFHFLFTKSCGFTCRSFIIRVNLADPAKMVLIECKFEIIYRCILTPDGSHSPFITQVPLQLVRPEVSYLKFGLIIRHIIDESSPLYGMDFEVCTQSDRLPNDIEIHKLHK